MALEQRYYFKSMLSGVFSCVVLSAHLNAQPIEADLYDLSLEQLGQITVFSASKAEEQSTRAPNIVSVISRQQIQWFGAINLAEVLERATSIYLTGSHFYPQNITSIRGDLATHANNHVLLMLDGRPIRDSITSGEHFSFFKAFPLTAVQQIEIIRGPGSVLHGSNAFVGSINVITRKQGDLNNEIGIQGGRFGYQALNLNQFHEVGEWKLTGHVAVSQEDGWPFKAEDFNGERKGIDYGEKNQGAFLTAHNKKFSAKALYIDSEADFWGAVTSWGGEPPAEDRRIASRRSMVDVGYRIPLTTTHQSDLHLTYSHMEFHHYNYDTESSDWLAEANHTWQPNPRVRWLFGATIWQQQGNSHSGLRDAPIPSFETTWSNLYSELNTRLTDSTAVVMGVQINKIKGLNTNSVPRFGFIHEFNQHWALKILHGEAYRAAYGVETKFNILITDDESNIVGGLRGNPELEPETATSSDVSLIYHDKLRDMSLTVFQSRQNNLVARERAADNVIDFVNRDELNSKGLELEYRQQLASTWFAQAAYTYQTNSLKGGPDDFTLVPNHLLKMGLVYHQADWSLGVFDNYVSAAGDVSIRNPNTLDVNPTASEYHLLSLNANWNIEKLLGLKDQNVTLSAYIYNFLNEEVNQPEFVGQRVNTLPSTSGRAWYASVKFRF